MIISATFSKPSSSVPEIFGHEYKKIKVKAVNVGGKASYFFEFFTETQVFHSNKTESELQDFIENHAGKTFKNAVIRTETEETTILSNKKGKITRLARKLEQKSPGGTELKFPKSGGRTKNYILPEGKPVPFLVLLGIMTDDGKIVSSKFDKFRQINRFLEFIDDILPEVLKLKKAQSENSENRNFENQNESPENGNTENGNSENAHSHSGDDVIRIVDFGSGKSYLTFAVHYFLTEIKNLKAEIVGLDLKKDVIDYCAGIAERLNLENISFSVGNISDYKNEKSPDIIITLHACDTATDFAIDYAVKNNAKAILSVPCCQHEINRQLDENLKRWKKSSSVPELFAPILKYGIAKERFSAVLTDVLRCEVLEDFGYSVNLMEFIDMENTPKNLLIRAVKIQESKKSDAEENDNFSGSEKQMTAEKKTNEANPEKIKKASRKLIETLEIKPTILTICD